MLRDCDKLRQIERIWTKKEDKMYHSFSGYPGGITSRKLEDVLKTDSRKAVWESVYGMLPKNKLRNVMMKKMILCKDDKHGVQGVEIEEIKPQGE